MKAPAGQRARRRGGLAGRLLVAQTLVLLTGTLTAWLIAATVGPTVFHNHLAQAHIGATSAQSLHTEAAYQSANAISLSVALLAALAVAMGVNVYITRRIGRPLATIADAAGNMAQGRYEVTVPPPGLGAEFDALASGFNQMAGQLRAVERSRSRLLADLGHEMRTPLATLEAYLQALEDGVATLDASPASLLRSQTRRLARLSEDIGTVSRVEEGQVGRDLHAVQPSSVVTAAVDSVAEAYNVKGVRLLKQIPPGSPMCAWAQTGWVRSWGTCWTTRCGTPHRVQLSRSRLSPRPGRVAPTWPSRTPATVSPASICLTCSNASTESIRPETVVTETQTKARASVRP